VHDRPPLRSFVTATVDDVGPYAPSMSEPLSHAARCRFRDLGIEPGVLAPGTWNALTDVAGVRVGHATLVEGDDVRTGVTAVLPHGGNPYRERVPAGVVVGNGFGKLIGLSQVRELGELETPIVLTNTLAAARAADALIDWTLALPGNEEVRSVNPFVGETNDGRLNDIRARGVGARDVLAALAAASSGSGRGRQRRRRHRHGGVRLQGRDRDVVAAPGEGQGGWTVGALVQANFGGVLTMDGMPVGKALRRWGAPPSGAADAAAPRTRATPRTGPVPPTRPAAPTARS
jgi:D-aminopeptidase